jgi:hypothetical protein
MPVFNCVCISPGGNRRSRPLIADTPTEALEDWRQEIAIESHGDVAGLIYEIERAHDPDGRMEQLLIEGQRRMLEDAFYRVSRKR